MLLVSIHCKIYILFLCDFTDDDFDCNANFDAEEIPNVPKNVPPCKRGA